MISFNTILFYHYYKQASKLLLSDFHGYFAIFLSYFNEMKMVSYSKKTVIFGYFFIIFFVEILNSYTVFVMRFNLPPNFINLLVYIWCGN